MTLILKIKNLLFQTNLQILDKQEIKLYFPNLINIVDLILVTPEYFICIKDYWTLNNYNNNISKSYLVDFNNIYLNYNKKFIFILLKKNTNSYKLNTNSNYVYLIEKNSQDNLILDLCYLLYSNSIYFYESDGSTIML